MKKMMKKLALILCAILTMNSVFVGAPVYVMAEDLPESATVSFGYDDTSLTFGEIQWKNGDEAWHTQSEAGSETATHLRIKYSNEGKLSEHTALRIWGVNIISENMSALESEAGMELTAGEVYEFEHIEFVSGTSTGPGGEVDPPLPEITDPIEISVSVKSYEENFFSEGNPIRIDRYEVRDGKVTVNKAETHNIEVQLDFGAGLSKFIVNDVECEFVSGAFDTYSVTVAEAASYTIELVKGDGHSVTIVWNYDREEAIRKYGNDDAWVENGRVELVSVKRGEDIIFDEENPTDEGISLREDGGDLFLEKGDDVVLRLVPDYGYQLVSVDINGVDKLKAEENVSTFTIENIQGNIHFKGVFQPADNFFYINSEVVRDVDILDGMNAAESGNLSLTLDDNKSYVTDISEVVEGEKVASIDLGLKNIVSKGSPDEYWESDITSFDDDIRIAMNIDFSQLSEDEEFTVVREHNGELEELPVFSDYENGVIDFPTNKFSTYTIVKKVVERINPEDIPDDHYWEYDFDTKRYKLIIDASNPCDELKEKNIVIPANYDLVIAKDFHTTGRVTVMSMGGLSIAKDCALSADDGVYIQDWAQLTLGNAKSATGFDNLYKTDEVTKYNNEDLNNTVFESVNGLFIDTTERPQDHGMQLNTNGTDPDCANSVISYKIYIDGDRTKAPIEGTFEREWEPVECDLKTGTIVDFHIATKKGYKILENGVRFPNNKMVISKEEDETKPSSNEAFEYEFDCSYTFTYTPDLYVSMTVDIIPIDVEPLELAEFTWTYDRAALASSEGFDVYVSHGTIEVLSAIDKDGKTLLNSKNPEMAPYWTPDDGSEEMSDWQGNRWQGQRAIFKAGTTVVVKLVPERGYQLTRFAISDIEGTTNPVEGDENTNTYTFVLKRPDFYHLGAVFTKVDDKVDADGVANVSGGSVAFAADEVSNGTMVLNVSDVEPSVAEMNKFNEMALQNNYSIEQVLNLESEQRFYKAVKDASRDQCWVIDKSELKSPATITLDISGISGEKVALLHNHNGVYEEIPATYENGSITFEANSFSDFAIVTQSGPKYTVEKPIISSSDEEPSETVYWVKKGAKIDIRCATNGSSIFYTTDGTNPDISKVYDGTPTMLFSDVFTIDKDTVVKAIAVKDGYADSEIVVKTYKVIDESADWGEIVVDAERGINDKAGFANADAVPNGLWVRGIKDYDYTGKAITQNDIRVYFGKKLLVLNKDYTVRYTNNTKACREGDKTKASIVITGKGDYSGTITEYFLINPLDISAAMVADENIVVAFNKNVQKKTTKVTYELGDKIVTLGGSDFTYVYPHTDNKITSGENAYDPNAFKAANTEENPYYEIHLVGKGNYTGERIVKETITDLTLMSTVTVSSIPNQPFTGEAITPVPVTVKKGNELLTLGVDYDITYENNFAIGKATATLTGKGRFAGKKVLTFNITGRNFGSAQFSKDFTTKLSKGYTWNENCTDGSGTILPCEIVDDFGADNILTFKYTEDREQKVDTLKGCLKSTYEGLSDVDKLNYDYIYEYVCEYVKAEDRTKTTSEIGTVKVNFEGVNKYTGKTTKQYRINGVAIGKTTVDYTNAFTYTGSAVEPDKLSNFKVYIKGTSTTLEVTLTKDTDYKVSYEKNVNAGTANLVITGINGYTGVVKKTFKINQYDYATNVGSRITVADIGEVLYQKGGAKPAVTVKDGDKVLELNKDYTVSYSNNTKPFAGPVTDANVRTAPTVKITGKGNYKGVIAKNYTIAKSDISEGAGIVAISSTDITYKNAVNTCKPTIKLIDSDGKVLAANTDYNGAITYRYAKDTMVVNMVQEGRNKVAKNVVRMEGEEVDHKNDIIPVGAEITATIVTTGLRNPSNYTGTREVTFRYISADMSRASVQVQPKEYEGKPVTLTKDEIVVKIGSEELKKTDYEIIGYAKNNAKGTAQVTLRGLGSYGGTKTVNFTIIAKSMNYTVVYNRNFDDVTGFMKNTVLAPNKKVISNTYKRNGYVFAGWSDTPGRKVAEIPNTGVLNVEDVSAYGTRINLYAQWTPVVNKITYNANGGKVTPTAEQATYTIETGIYFLPEPTKAGYTFAGWYTTSNFKEESKVTSIPTGWYGNKTLFAKWVK